jgi:hypothetical protein
MFGFSILYYTAFNVDDQSYRQVLTLINNFQLLLKLEILDKFRLLQTNNSNTKETATFSSLHQYRRNGSSHDLETLSIDLMTLAALCVQAFSLLMPHKLGHFRHSQMKHCRYHNIIR